PLFVCVLTEEGVNLTSRRLSVSPSCASSNSHRNYSFRRGSLWSVRSAVSAEGVCVCVFLCVSLSLCFSISVFLCVSLSLCFSLFLYLCVSLCFSISVFLYLCVSLCFSISVFLCVSLSLCF